MLDPISQTESAYRDTLIAKAQGHGFDALARHYSFPRLASISRKYWRRALLALVFGHKGTLGTTFAVLEAIFDFFAEPRMVHRVSVDPAKPTALTHLDAFAVGGAPGWHCGHTGRFLRCLSPPYLDKLYYSEHLSEGKLYLSGVTTSYWTAADFSDADDEAILQFKILPFTFREPQPGPPWLDGTNDRGEPWHPIRQQLNLPGGDEGFRTADTARFEIFIDEFIWPLPATYLQADGTIDRTVAAPGQPYGGHIMDLVAAANDPAIPESGDPRGEGPHPIYFSSGTIGAEFFNALLDTILASGVWMDSVVFPWCDEPGANVFDPIFDLDATKDNEVNAGRLQMLPGFGDRAAQEHPWDFQNHGLPRNWDPDRDINNFPENGALTSANIGGLDGFTQVYAYDQHIYFFVSTRNYDLWNGFVFFPEPPRSSWPWGGMDMRDDADGIFSATSATTFDYTIDGDTTSFSWALSGELQPNGASAAGYTGTPVPGDGTLLNSWLTAPSSNPEHPTMYHMIRENGGQVWHPHFENFLERSILLDVTHNNENTFHRVGGHVPAGIRQVILGANQAPTVQVGYDNQALCWRVPRTQIVSWDQGLVQGENKTGATFRIADNQIFLPPGQGTGVLSETWHIIYNNAYAPLPAGALHDDNASAIYGGHAGMGLLPGRADVPSMDLIAEAFNDAGIP